MSIQIAKLIGLIVSGAAVIAFSPRGQAQQIDWDALRSTDLKQYAQRLRSAGVPSDVILDIISAQTERDLIRQWSADSSGAEFQFWTIEFSSPASKKAALEAYFRNRLVQAKIEQVGAVLGNEMAASLNSALDTVVKDTAFGFLPAGKRSEIAEIKKSYEEQIAKSIVGPPPEPSELARVALLRHELQTELARRLTPEEKREYDLRFSNVAARLRLELVAFKPTEDEFRKLYDLFAEFDRKTEGPEFAALPLDRRLQQLQEARDRLNSEIPRALGQARYAEYQRALSPRFQVLRKFLSKQSVADAILFQVYDLEEGVGRLIQGIFAREDLTGGEKQALVSRVRLETEKALQSLLGSSTFSAFLNHPASDWLRAIR